MPVYTYKAKSVEQALVQGTVASDSPRQARQSLREQGLTILDIEEQTSKRTGGLLGVFERGMRQEIATFCGELATLLSVGVPLLESLDTLIRQYKGKFHRVLLMVRDEVAGGVSFADALRNQGGTFDALVINMVEVGESTGNLDEVMEQLATFKQRSLELKDRVLSSLLYPMIVLSVSVVVSIFLMTVVVPTLLQNLLEAGRELPWPTRALKGLSDLLVHHGIWIFGVGLSILLGVIFGLKTHTGKRLWNRLLLKIPVIGMMNRKQETARVSLVIATLLKSGVEFVKALEIASRTTNNILVKEALELSQQEIGAGKDIGQSFQASDFFPPMVSQIFHVGQKSGRLEKMLFRLADDYDSQVNSLANRMSSIIEPVLILILSIFVGFILFATLLPILEAGNVLQQ